MRSAERVQRKADPGVAAPAQAAPVSSGVGSVLALQRKAGNRATTAMLSRKVAKSTVAGEGPIAEIADSALSGDAKAVVEKAVPIIKSGGANPWPQRGWKWGVNHGNREGNLPGKKGAGGYKEYYLSKKPDATVFDPLGRLVVGGGEVYHTATHYGQSGSPAFTHYGKL